MASFAKQLLNNVMKTAEIIAVFEKHGFKVESIDQYMAISAELGNTLTGGSRKRKAGRPAGTAPKKRGRKRGRPAKAASPVEGVKRGPGRPPKKKRGRPAKKQQLETPVTTTA